MSHYRRLIACFLFCGVALHAFAEVESQTKNYPGPYRPWSLEFQKVNPEDLYHIDAEGLAKMSLSDSLLKYAYMDVFLRNVGGLDNLEPEQALVLADMRSRGEGITPMLLKLAIDNQETIYECALLSRIDQVKTVNLDPYLAYARNLLRERTQTMSATNAACATAILSRHGTVADIELLEKVLEERPYVADDVSRYLKRLQERLNSPMPKSRRIPKNELKGDELTTESTTNKHLLARANTSNDKIPSKMWIAWILLAIMSIGILYLLIKNGLKRGQ